MRQVFTSARLENVEAVAQMLRAEGIEVKVSNDRSYRGNRRSNFSYADPGNAASQAAVWIINAEDQPRARQMLRDAGLLESSREGASSFLPPPAALGERDLLEAGKRKRTRIRLLLLGLIGIVGLLIAFTMRQQDKAAATPAKQTAAMAAKPAPVIVPQSVDDLQAFRIDVPSALAKLLVEDALAKRKPAQACIAIDGKDATPPFIAALDAKTQVVPASQCQGDAALRIDVRNYMTDGSGRGEVEVKLGADAARSFKVERNGAIWRVL